MGSEWRYGRMDEVVDFLPKRTIKKGSVEPFIAMADIPENSREPSNISQKEFKGGGSKFCNGDTVFARITPCLQNGKTAKISGLIDGQVAHGSTEFIILGAKESTDQDYIYYLSRLPEFRAYAESRMEGSTGRQRVSWQALSEYELNFPTKKERRKIGEFLSVLDNKIELNRQTNETLEKMAQALFKSWFVDFDPVIDNALAAGNTIPDDLQDRAERRQQQRAKPDHQPLPDAIRQLFPSEFEFTEALGWVPMGWEVKPFGDLLEMTIGGDWGKDVPDEKHTVESVIVRGTDIPKLTSGSQSSAPARWVEPKKLKTRSLSDSDIVIEVSGGSSTQPTGRSIMMTKNLLDRLGGTVEPASFCRKFRPLNREIGLVLGLHLRNIYADGKTWEYQNTSTGISNFQTKMFLANELVLTPNSNKLISEFYRIVRPIIDRITNNDSIHLEKLRDTLLPKLISGELRLPSDASADAEQPGTACAASS